MVIVIGTLVLCGWIFEIKSLTGLFAGIVMKVNTAIAFILAGISLLALNADENNKPIKTAGYVAAVTFGLIGLLTLSEHLFGWNLHIDELLMKEPPGAAATVSPGRMGPPSSISFTLLSVMLLLFYSHRSIRLAQVITGVVGFWALLVVLGYAYEAKALYGIAPYTGVALTSAIAFIILTLGILAANYSEGFMSIVSSNMAGGVMARRLLIVAVIIPFVLGWLHSAGQRAGYYDLGFGTAVLVVAIIALFTLAIWRVGLRLNEMERLHIAAEAVAVRSESGLRQQAALINLSYEAIFIWDFDGGILEWNNGSQQTYGYTREEAIGSTSHDLLKSREESAAEERLQTLLRDGQWTGELSHTTRDGREVLVESRQQLIEADGRRLVLETNRDITGRRQQEAARYRLAAIVESSDDAVIGKTMEGIITNWNVAATRIFGYSAEEAIGKPITMLIPTDRHNEEVEILRRLRRGERIDHFETVRVTRDGHFVDVSLTISPIKNDAGEVIGASKIMRDITDRRRVEQALREGEERQRLALDLVEMATWDVDLRSGKAKWSDKHFLLLGYDIEEDGDATFEMWKSRVHPEDYDQVMEAIERSKEEKTLFKTEHRIVRADNGEIVWIAVAGSFLYDNAGEATRFMGLFFDITDRKRVDEERELLLNRAQVARSDAEAANRLKDEFLATVSHELRTPLNAILGWATMLRVGKIDEKTSSRALETIERNARVQSQLIEDILDVSRMMTGKLGLDVRPVELLTVIEAAVDAVRPAAEAKAIRVQNVLDPRAGPVLGDSNRLQQIVWNLLSNAIKFTPRDGRVMINLKRVDSHVELMVTDTGEGISEEFLPFLFDRFRQADSTMTRRLGGLGLGLAIVRQLVEMHAGSVSAESEGKDKGATFVVQLPIMVLRSNAATDESLTDFSLLSNNENMHPTATDTTPAVDAPRLDGMRVLVVEDECDSLELLRTFLTQCGAKVEVASSASAGLKELQSFRPDILVSDIEMPEEDGYTFIGKVRMLGPENGGATPAVALTAHARPEDRMRALSAGFQIHVPKPVEPTELAVVLSSLSRRIAS